MNKKLIAGAAIAVSAILLISAGIIRSIGAGRGITVKAAEIGKGDVSSYISTDGIIEEAEKAEVFFDTPLKVKKIFVEAGQEVTKGQPLMELDLSALNSQLETLRISRSTQENSLNSSTLDAEVERAKNNLDIALRNYNDAKQKYDEKVVMYNASAISKEELEMAEKALKEAESGMSGLRNAQLAYDSAVESRENTRRSLKDNLKVLDIQISDLEKKIEDTVKNCQSPMNGVVAYLGVQENAFTSSMQAAYRIFNPEKLQIRAWVKEFDIKSVSEGQTVRITGEAIDETKEVTGKVRSISPVAVSKMSTAGNETVVEVIIDVDKTDASLKPGLNVTCDIYTVNKKDVLLVPMEALTLDVNDNNMVFVIDKGAKTLVKRNVTVGINSDMYVEVLDGLSEGDIVVLDPLPAYTDGSRVKAWELK